MKHVFRFNQKSRFPYIYELFVWLLYVSLYKYDHYLEILPLPVTREDFPYLQLMPYAICMTLYVIPFYRWLAPMLLRNKRYILFFFTVIFYFGFVSRVCNYLVSLLFHAFNDNGPLEAYFQRLYLSYGRSLWHLYFVDLRIMTTDLIAFVSLTFLWYAFENEQKKHLLEKDNLQLQLEALKAQLHPHFLFNTLNNIYGMSLTGSKETPSFILRLSNMMRFILYDCRHHQVSLEKEIEFLTNYLEMEKQRYPDADIQFSVTGSPDHMTMAPLLFLPFIENSCKHGSYRLNGNGFIHSRLQINNDHIEFKISNDVFNLSNQRQPYGGVGIENVKKRLSLYYPGRHQLTIDQNNDTFEVTLKLFY